MRKADGYASTMRHLIPEFLRFCIVGGIAFVTDYAFLELFAHFGLAVAIARIGSLIIALHVSYFLHGVFTYRGHRGYTRATWLQFMGSNIFGALINYGLFLAVVALIPFDDARLTRLAGMVIGTAISMGFNYWANKRFAFARKDAL
jgi:putative flippase GtrA